MGSDGRPRSPAVQNSAPRSVFSDSVIAAGAPSRRVHPDTWSRQQSPNPGNVPSQLESVSCTTPGDCTAVGLQWVYRNGQLGFDPLVVRTTDGATWQSVGGELTADWREATLWGVSCSAPTRCHAVGYVSRVDRRALVMRTRTGDFWRELPAPTVNGRDHWLRAIDCTTALACTAVGRYAGGAALDRALVMRTTNGNNFAKVESPNPAGSDLHDVSCSSATSCTAVGHRPGQSMAFVLRGAGFTWTRALTPTAPGVYAARCLVPVGEPVHSGRRAFDLRNVAPHDRWRDLVFAESRVRASPENAQGGELSAAAEVHRGGKLQPRRATPSTHHARDVGDGGMMRAKLLRRIGVVGCLTALVAAGSVGVAHADNPWVRVAAPAPGTDAGASSVSCVSETMCTAVGTYSTAAGASRTLIMRTVDGLTWTRQASPNPAGGNSHLTSVSCTSATHCTAVGSTSFLDGILVIFTLPLVVRTTDGVTWQAVGGQLNGQFSEASLYGVSCRSATRCFAVGTLVGDHRRALILRTTNGTFWRDQSQVTTTGTEHWLRAVDCTSNVRCTAVGTHSNGSQRPRTLVMRTIDGRTWAQVPSPNAAPGTTGSSLDAIDCVGPTCTIVGYGSVTDRALILRTTDGTTWTRMPTPVASGMWLMHGISCQSTTECTAVGNLDHGSAHELVILRTADGSTWSTPDPSAHKIRRSGRGVSCAVALRCFAVGSFQSFFQGPSKALILRET